MKRNIFRLFRWQLFLIIISVLPLWVLTAPGMFVAHDAQDHVARIANFYQNLQEGNVIPRWAGNLNWGYGHPILMFLYPLPSYVASIFRSLGFSLVDSTKLVFALGFAGSGIAMYMWIRKVWGEYAGAASAVLYMFSPYRFVDMYVRGAIGENFFFVFPPLTCYFITVLFTSSLRIGIIGGALSFAGMVLSHNALTIMFLPFIGLYTLLFLFKKKIQFWQWIGTFLIFMLGFGISAFFWVPAFLEGKYTLRDIVTKNEVFSRFETFNRLVYSPWRFGGTGEFTVQIGIIQWIIIIVSTLCIASLLLKKRKQLLVWDNIFLVILTTTFWVSILYMLPISKPLYQLITVLQKFQFPWRFLSLALFPPAVLGGFLMSKIRFPFKNYLLVVLIFMVILATGQMWKPEGFVEKPESFYSGIYEGTTDTGESAPIWSVRFMLEKPKAYAEIAEGSGAISLIARSTTRHEYQVEVNTEAARFIENTLYFPGWFVYVDKQKLAPESLGFHNPDYRGLINFPVAAGLHDVVVEFRETRLRILANSISVGSGIILLIFWCLPERLFLIRHANPKQ